MHEVLPSGSATEEDFLALREESLAHKEVNQIAKKQKEGGTWGGTCGQVSTYIATEGPSRPPFSALFLPPSPAHGCGDGMG